MGSAMTDVAASEARNASISNLDENRLTDTALSCRPPMNVPGPDRRTPGESTPEPGGRRLGSPRTPGAAAGQLQCLVRRRPLLGGVKGGSGRCVADLPVRC